MENQAAVIIVGAGPGGLATAACLSHRKIPYILLEREDCFAPLWTKYSYDRLHLHLAKQFCQLPHMQFPSSYPTFISKTQFIQYLNDYVSHFNITPIYRRSVELAGYDEKLKKWVVKARNVGSGEIEEYSGGSLVIATGETSDPFIPEIDGLSSFNGEIIHSTGFKNGKSYDKKNVLVVGSGNSGMEIALDLAVHGSKTSVVVRSPAHFLSKEIVYAGLTMLKYFPLWMVDSMLVILSKIIYGDMSKYGIRRPEEGPFFLKVTSGKYPIIDLGTCKKIRSGEIQVLPAIQNIRGDEVLFENGKSHPFDAIVFCTGFKRSTNQWLKGDDYLLNDEGIPKPSFPNHWKGRNGLYCVGLARRGLYGIRADAQNAAADIQSVS